MASGSHPHRCEHRHEGARLARCRQHVNGSTHLPVHRVCRVRDGGSHRRRPRAGQPAGLDLRRRRVLRGLERRSRELRLPRPRRRTGLASRRLARRVDLRLGLVPDGRIDHAGAASVSDRQGPRGPLGRVATRAHRAHHPGHAPIHVLSRAAGRLVLTPEAPGQSCRARLRRHAARRSRLRGRRGRARSPRGSAVLGGCPLPALARGRAPADEVDDGRRNLHRVFGHRAATRRSELRARHPVRRRRRAVPGRGRNRDPALPVV
jgi:hypothetical protein